MKVYRITANYRNEVDFSFFTGLLVMIELLSWGRVIGSSLEIFIEVGFGLLEI